MLSHGFFDMPNLWRNSQFWGKAMPALPRTVPGSRAFTFTRLVSSASSAATSAGIGVRRAQ